MSKESLYRDTNIPLPSKPLVILEGDSVEVVCGKIDDYFEDIIRDYPAATQELVRDMYYNNTNVKAFEYLFELRGSGAIYQPHVDENGTLTSIVYIDSELIGCPIKSRISRIHEIACHAGQAHQSMNDVGADEWLEQYKNGNFRKFSEQSAVLSDKVLIDAIPDSVIEIDIQNIVTPDIRFPEAEYDSKVKKMSFSGFTRLKHRLEDWSEEGYKLLQSRPDVQIFNAQMSNAYIQKEQKTLPQGYVAMHQSSSPAERMVV